LQPRSCVLEEWRSMLVPRPLNYVKQVRRAGWRKRRRYLCGKEHNKS